MVVPLAGSSSKAALPMISCLMLTQPMPARLLLLRHSISDYCRQTHPRRELVIIADVSDAAAAEPIRQLIESFGRDDLRLVLPPTKLRLGILLYDVSMTVQPLAASRVSPTRGRVWIA